MRFIPVGLIVLFLMACSGGDEPRGNIVFDTSLDTTAGHIGDIFHYTLSLDGLTDQSIVLPTLVIPEGEVRSVSLLEDKKKITGAEFQIVYWDTGQQIIPSFTLDILKPDSSVEISFKSDPRFITIYPVVSATDQPELKPLKPPLPVKKPLPWRMMVLLAIVLLLLAGMIFIWRKRSRHTESIEEKIEFIEPDRRALRRLRELKKSDCTDIKNTYTILSHILREYIEYSFYIRTLEMTTEEIVSHKDIFGFSDILFEELIALLKRSDLTKYARHIPDLATLHRDIEWANQFIARTTPLWKVESET